MLSSLIYTRYDAEAHGLISMHLSLGHSSAMQTIETRALSQYRGLAELIDSNGTVLLIGVHANSFALKVPLAYPALWLKV